MAQSEKHTPKKAGDLDPDFANNGRIIVSDLGHAKVAIEDEGGIVYVVNVSKECRLRRAFADGSPDLSFGVNGAVTWQFERGETSLAFQLLRQQDGKLLVMGISQKTIFMWRTAITRFHPNGSPDLIFGMRFLPFPEDPEHVRMGLFEPTARLQVDGRILLVSNYQVVDEHGDSIYQAGRLHRLNDDGSPDLTFGVRGYIDVRVNGQDTEVRSIAVLQDQKIIVGTTLNRVLGHEANSRASLACYMPNGRLDQGFGKSGYWEESIFSHAYKMIVHENRIIVLGTHLRPSEKSLVLVTRLTAEGLLDPTFNNATTLLIDLDQVANYPEVLSVQSDGKIILAVTTYEGQWWPHLIRVKNEGVLDEEFGDQGIVKYGEGSVGDGFIQSNTQRIIMVHMADAYSSFILGIQS